jgi:hypothetical protein
MDNQGGEAQNILEVTMQGPDESWFMPYIHTYSASQVQLRSYLEEKVAASV